MTIKGGEGGPHERGGQGSVNEHLVLTDCAHCPSTPCTWLCISMTAIFEICVSSPLTSSLGPSQEVRDEKLERCLAGEQVLGSHHGQEGGVGEGATAAGQVLGEGDEIRNILHCFHEMGERVLADSFALGA